MDRDTSIETHKALDEILNILKGSEPNEWRMGNTYK
jgi:hypothetical protein